MTIRLIDGVSWRLRNFQRLFVCVKRTCSPSYSNHIGLTWTVSSGRIVPSAPNSGRSSSGSNAEGMVALMTGRSLAWSSPVARRHAGDLDADRGDARRDLVVGVQERRR